MGSPYRTPSPPLRDPEPPSREGDAIVATLLVGGVLWVLFAVSQPPSPRGFDSGGGSYVSHVSHASPMRRP